MTKFLTIKHWQLFGLLIGLPMALQFIIMAFVSSSNDPTTMFYFFPIMMILFIGLFFGWFYALGTNLHKKLPSTVTMNLKRFKIFLLIPVVYMLLISVFMVGMFSNISSGGHTNPAIFILIVSLHLFSMFCIFYCLYFNAKALKTVEWQKPVTFSDFAGEFFLIWFFPIGIWIIQPRINKLFDTNIDNDNNQILDNNIQ
ncbi:MAG: hypothetical protein ABI378_03095 [Chitinophagaceae bacterium]